MTQSNTHISVPGDLKLNFRGADLVERNFSQAGQDLFVLSLLDGKRDGVFLDLGCNQPIKFNNTYLLESVFGWTGLSIDIEPSFFRLYVFRKTKTHIGDAAKLDWDVVIDMLGTTHVDYLSLDLEPPMVTLSCLESIPFDRMEFSVITFEHDSYRVGDDVRSPSRQVLEGHGYQRLASNVSCDGCVFEDWYFNPEYVSGDRARVLFSEDKDWNDVLFHTDH